MTKLCPKMAIPATIRLASSFPRHNVAWTAAGPANPVQLCIEPFVFLFLFLLSFLLPSPNLGGYNCVEPTSVRCTHTVQYGVRGTVNYFRTGGGVWACLVGFDLIFIVGLLCIFPYVTSLLCNFKTSCRSPAIFGVHIQGSWLQGMTSMASISRHANTGKFYV